MAIREYVGARYVPRFCGAYDVTQQYDALDVVDNGAGTSYIARKTVPAGIPLTDSAYWIIYGASSGAILDLQNRMDAAENDIDNIENDISSLDGRTNTLESDMTTAKGNIQTLQQLTRRRYVLIGDSYAEGTGVGISSGWTQQFKTMLNLSNDDCYITYLGGSGFVGNVGTRFIDLLNNIYPLVNNPNTITDVVVCGGHNDAGKSNLDTSVNSFCLRAQTLFPNATISIGMIAYNTQLSGSIRKILPQTMAAYYGGATGKFKVMTDIEFALRKSSDYMSSDGIHPSAFGYLSISKGIISAVLGGSGFQYAPSDAIAVGFKDITNHTKTVYQRMFKNRSTLLIPFELGFITVGSTKPNINTWYKIGDLTSNNLLHGAATSLSDLDAFGCMGNCILQGNYANGSFRDCPCMLGIYQNSLYIKLMGIDPSTGVFINTSSIENITPTGAWEFETIWN